MSPASCLTMAAALALLSATPVLARGPAQHLAPRMAPQMFRAPVLAGKAAAKMAPAPQITFKQTPKIAPASIRVAPIHVGSRIVHLRPDPARRHGRREAFIALGAPFYAAGPVQVVQKSVEYVPVERPLVSVYGEPPIIRAPVCSQPAVHYVTPSRASRALPQVIYGVQPECGPALPAPASGGHVRALY